MNYNEYLDSMKNDRKNQAIIISAQMFMESGISYIKMTDIAKESEIGVASLYRYFGTKKQLVIEVATYIWSDLKPLFNDVILSEDYNSLSGLKQIERLISLFPILFNQHQKFLKFISDFDNYIRTEKVNPNELKTYESNIIDFYFLFKKAVAKGRNEGTIKTDFDCKIFYLSMSHALISLCQKLIFPGILTSDNQISGEEEINSLITIGLNFIKI